MGTKVTKRLFTTKEFHRMVEVGILSESDRVELIEGEIVDMTPTGSKHAACVDRLNRLLTEKIRDEGIVRVQSPIQLSKDSESQPDLAILKPREDFYEKKHPGPEDTLLIVEVAETAQEYDSEVKIPLYGENGVQLVWLVDLEAEVLEVHSVPGSRGYKKVEKFGRSESVKLGSLSEKEVSVSSIFG